MANRLKDLNFRLAPPNIMAQIRKRNTLDLTDIRKLVFSNGYSTIQSLYAILDKNRHLIVRDHIDQTDTPTIRLAVVKLMVAVMKEIKVDLIDRLEEFFYIYYALSSFEYQLALKICLHLLNYTKAIITFGTSDGHRELVRRAMSFEDIGAYCLTEFHHGSYSKGMQTEAHYDHTTQEFVLTTNGAKGMKFWIGGLAEISNMALVWAQLVVKGKSYGPHPFVIPIRSRKTHRVLPQIVIGDVGPKSSGNGMDNGYLILNNIRVPKDSLLGKLGDIDKHGDYKTSFKNAGVVFGMHMSPLSTGRAFFAYGALSYSVNGLTIAMRYTHTRRQFESANKTGEVLLIDYPLTKFRLIPLVAKTFVYLLGSQQISRLFIEHAAIFGDAKNKLAGELHAISSTVKSKATWHTAATLSQCRAMLGGHGYSAFSRLGTMYQDNEAKLTGQGDNFLLLQQTCKFVLKIGSSNQATQLIDLQFLKNQPATLQAECDLRNFTNIELMLKNLLISKYTQAKNKMLELMGTVEDATEQWNYLQPYFGTSLALIFGDYYFLSVFKEKTAQLTNSSTKVFANKCLILWALQLFEQERYGSFQFRQRLQRQIVKLCEQLAEDALVFLDFIAPPEFIIGSPFANRDGQGFKEYRNLIMTSRDAFKRVEWFEEIVNLRKTDN